MRLFENIIPATFLARPNRFVVECLVRGRKVRAYLPNPGRLWELLFPGTTVYLTAFPNASENKLPYLAVAVERDGLPVMLHTHHTNTVAAHLIRNSLVPGLEGAEIVQPEYRIGRSRFDFLLRKNGRDILLEVKSCTLFNDTLAMFPDAVSARATKHLLELEELSRRGYGAAVLFVVHSPGVRWFMPEHHTDLLFTRTLCDVRGRVMVRAVSVEWEKDLSLGGSSRELMIPWDLAEREARDRGAYLIVLRLPRRRTIRIGSLGPVTFPKGYYLYVGSAMKDLTQRIARHQRLLKKHHWHIDYLRAETEFVSSIPVRSSADRECEIAASLAEIAGWQVPAFGSSDCSCATHLFGMHENPVHTPKFVTMLLSERMGRLEQELRETGR